MLVIRKIKRNYLKRNTISLLADFSVAIMENRKQWKNIFSVLKKKSNYQFDIQYLVKLSFKNEDEVILKEMKTEFLQ